MILQFVVTQLNTDITIPVSLRGRYLAKLKHYNVIDTDVIVDVLTNTTWLIGAPRILKLTIPQINTQMATNANINNSNALLLVSKSNNIYSNEKYNDDPEFILEANGYITVNLSSVKSDISVLGDYSIAFKSLLVTLDVEYIEA